MMKSLIIISVSFLIFCTSYSENADKVKSIDAVKLIDILSSENYSEIHKIQLLLKNEWSENNFENIDGKDKLFYFCSQQIQNFKWWIKYKDYSSEQFDKIDKKDKLILDKNMLYLYILLSGALIDNETAKKQLNILKKDDVFAKISENLTKIIKEQNERDKAKNMLKSNYNIKCEYAISLLKENVNTMSTKNISFFSGISQDVIFLNQLENDIERKDKIHALIQKKFPEIKGTLQKDRSLRDSLISLFTKTSTSSVGLAWLHKIIQQNDLSSREKDLLQRKIFILENSK